MNRQQALEILELPRSASKDEVKKKFRQLSKIYHPDVNKEPGAEERFKKINEAFAVASKNKFVQRTSTPIQLSNIEKEISISFKESVLGCRKEITLQRRIMCHTCGGSGAVKESNGCSRCNGSGMIVQRQGNTIFSQTCNGCYGKVELSECQSCYGEGAVESESKIQVNIPPGCVSGNVLRISGMGHFVEATGFMGMMSAHYTDTYLKIKVDPLDSLRIESGRVVSDLKISLAEAVRGVKKTILTINGEQEVEIPELSRHKDEISVSGVGLGGTDNQYVILDVTYPADISELLGKN